ncbi:hypothetical protein O181_062634 [Austropuccinia psidii MF-1]|uniref:Reverse transcriptase/retrotransposon-derived protein RNase H-like domain-containing protein n=1 Tax=Austropuccinia psidii MF-1 TaxID=1389203 RepID=A0A9Q3EKR9_9BASI|nr:hypothetical protein [Austropuccinia psidii MF-1]
MGRPCALHRHSTRPTSITGTATQSLRYRSGHRPEQSSSSATQTSKKEHQRDAIFLGFSSYYRNHIRNFAHITSSLYKLCSKDLVFEITKERRDAYERIKHELTDAPMRILPEFELPFKLYIDAACSQGFGAALHQIQIADGEPREEMICYISRQLKNSEARDGATQP